MNAQLEIADDFGLVILAGHLPTKSIIYLDERYCPQGFWRLEKTIS